MALTKERVLDRVTILEDGVIEYIWADYILEDGVRITNPKYHREADATPSDTIDPGLPQLVKDVAAVAWTPAVIAAYGQKN